MSFTVKVLHRNWLFNEDRTERVGEVFEEVAVVTVPDQATVEDALDYAYRWTNNLNGSWSRKDLETYEVEGKVFDNTDVNPDVVVLSELPKRRDGKVMGLRSTSCDDQMIVNKEVYEVANFGFDKIGNL